MKNQELIKQEVEKRGVKYLLHFTKTKNLKSIIDNGLITRDKVIANLNEQSINDEHRFDQTNGICTSISFPNYKMFYTCRERYKSDEWVVLGISPNVLWEKRCAFYFTNAASKLFRLKSLEEQMSYENFSLMFGENEKQRSLLGIPDSFTTNPQAEVIFLEDIQKSYIFAFATPNIQLQIKLKDQFQNERFVLKSELFSYRRDFVHWKKPEIVE